MTLLFCGVQVILEEFDLMRPVVAHQLGGHPLPVRFKLTLYGIHHFH